MPRLTPTLVQAPASLRNDGSVSLASPPTVGNLMVLAIAGWGSNMNIGQAYTPSGGWNLIGIYYADINNAVSLWQRRVRTGDAGSVSLSGQDNHAAVIYEYQNAVGCYPLSGGAMGQYFSSNNFSLPIVRSPFGINDQVICIFQHDTTPVWGITGETGVVVDYITPSSEFNHTSAFARSLPTHIDRGIEGSIIGTPVSPVFGQFVVVGDFG